ncbi:aminopeptidase N isoform X2 [Agrilus planipennis]|uniref:Aminopeptidase n=1 Tax=Agrilus planipennis TaxID=224129 RepID=A0A1W4WRQ9_AGRPL|nr:aminopeptidase N isoform X2 [Agrilus planipennis]
MQLTSTVLILFLLVFKIRAVTKRSIDLIETHNLISDTRLPHDIAPTSYKLVLSPYPFNGTFSGQVIIGLVWQEETNKIVLHAHESLTVFHDSTTVKLINGDGNESVEYFEDDNSNETPAITQVIKVISTEKTKSFYTITLEKPVKNKSRGFIEIFFTGILVDNRSEGMFRISYVDNDGLDNWIIGTNFRPNRARMAFPCFDEPAYKVPFNISVAHHKSTNAISNMPPLAMDEHDDPGWMWTHFSITPPMSTFSVGVVVGSLKRIIYNISKTDDLDVSLGVWGTIQYLPEIEKSLEKIATSLRALQEFWSLPYPLPKLDCVALPYYHSSRPSDSWGLIMFKENELTAKGSWQITHELVYQWLGNWASPYWWTDAHINNALARYVTTYITLKITDHNETFHNWPMTMLYSIYYEFSKRYPHGKATAIKQDSGSAKTELVFRMLNYTLGEHTVIHGLQRFMSERQYSTFFGDDTWASITDQARFDKTLDDTISATDIAASWILKDRLPVVDVERNYGDGSANITQKVYLRERPHDVPDQEKFLWWIPIVMVNQSNLDFTKFTPVKWMKREREVRIENVAKSDEFIIVNPEEIGPFPVNYDCKNWNMLARFLLTNDGRKKIPVNTRAKLLHDAWNLAYAGDLSFGTALNMTLFLQHEREHLAWYPIFTMIDHIGRHIDSSEVHAKFQTYVRLLLTPLYEELGNEPVDGESEGTTQLRESVKVFLCQAGYKPCIKEAQEAFHKWMKAESPDEGNPVQNRYICPVFKWGTKQEWEFGLQRVINFPAERKQNERTYLLKTLAGCPADPWKVEKILNVTIMENNGNFTDNDIYLIFSMLTGSSNGYTTLFNFLNTYWDTIKTRFETKPQLWNALINSATSVFKTQEGLDMVSKLYVEKQGDFGTADFVIEKSLKNIKEETKWSDENLPVIELWLDKYLKDNNVTVDAS